MGEIHAQWHVSKSGQAFQIRTALPEDASQILALSKEVMGEGIYTLTLPEELTFTEEEEAGLILKFSSNPTSLALVAVVEGQGVGFLSFQAAARKRVAHTGEFGMCILKPYRELGIGRG